MARRQQLNRQPLYKEQSVPAPFGGWNTRDAIDAMPPTDAFVMDNWIPDTGNVRTRDGHSEHATISAALNEITFGNSAVITGTTQDIDTSHTMESADGRILIAAISAEDSSAVNGVASVTFDPGGGEQQSFTKIRHDEEAGGFVRTELWYLLADSLPTSTAYTIRCSFTSSSNTNSAMRTQTIIDAVQQAPEQNNGDTITTGTSLDTSMTGITDNALVYEIASLSTSESSLTPVGDQDAEQSQVAVNFAYMYSTAYMNAVGAGTYNIDTDLGISARGTNSVASFEASAGAGGTVETLMAFEGLSEKLLAATTTTIWDVTTAGPATSLKSGFTNGRWDWANWEDTLVMVNGSNTPQQYDGTTVSDLTITGGGLTSSDLDWVHVFKSFSFFGDSTTQDFWYSAVNVLGGAVNKFPLSRVSRLGGKLIDMKTLSATSQAGEVISNVAAFIMDTGEVILYAGTDPGDAAAWAIIGIYRIGRPIGDGRGAVNIDGDIYVITDQDYVSLTEAIKKSGRVRPSKLSGAAKDVTTKHKNNTGWEFVYLPKEQLIWVNVPVTATTYNQHGINLATGSSFRFTGYNARCWGVHKGDAYFGTTDGRVMQALDGLTDDGETIDATVEQSWTDLGAAVDKEITATRPILSAQGSVRFGLGFSMDYRGAEAPTVTSNPGAGTPWGSPWGSPWSPATDIRDDWFVGGYYGRKVSAKINISTQNQTFAWYRTDYEYEVAR